MTLNMVPCPSDAIRIGLVYNYYSSDAVSYTDSEWNKRQIICMHRIVGLCQDLHKGGLMFRSMLVRAMRMTK